MSDYDEYQRLVVELQSATDALKNDKSDFDSGRLERHFRAWHALELLQAKHGGKPPKPEDK